MDKRQFIAQVFAMFPSTFTDNNTSLWLDVYQTQIPEGLDYKELFDDMLKNHEEIGFAPSLAFFKPYINKQLERQKKLKSESEFSKKKKQWEEEIAQIEKNDKPLTKPVLTPMQLMIQNGLTMEHFKTHYGSKVRPLFQRYVASLQNHKATCDFWREVCKLTLNGGNVDELCRDMQKVC